MAKYYKFHYSAGYAGTDEYAIYEFSDDASYEEVEKEFDNWYESTRADTGGFERISKEEAEDEGVDERLVDV